MSKKTNELDSFDEQGFMIRLLPLFSGLKGTSLYEGYEYVERLKDGEDNITFLADLESAKEGDKFKRFNLTERLPKEIISSLNPYVKIYKVFYKDEKDMKGNLAQFSFNNMKEERVDLGANQYGGGFPGQLAVGLKEFSFDYLGTHPGEVDTFIDCNLKLYFSSIEALFKEYNYKDGEQKGKLSFIDLIKRPKRYITGNPESDTQVYNEKYFRIRVDVGYTAPDDAVIQDAVRALPLPQGLSRKKYAEALKKEIENTNVSFFLNLQRHTISPLFDTPSGAFEMDITFNASVESAITSKGSNILLSGLSGTDIDKIQSSRDYITYQNAKQAVTRAFNGDTTVIPVLETLSWSDFFNEDYVRDFRTGVDAAKPKAPHYLVRTNADAFRSLLNTNVPLEFYESLSRTQDRISRDPQDLMNDVFQEFRDQKTRSVFNYFVRRQVLEDFKRASGLTEKGKRIQAYNRMVRELITPKQDWASRAHDTMPIKSYRTSVSRSLIREYNNKLFASRFTEEELETIQAGEREGSGQKAKKQAKEARAQRRQRQSSLLNFIKELETGQRFGNAQGIGGSLDEQMKKYTDEVKKSVKEKTSTSEEMKMPYFAVAKPKVDDSDPQGKVDLRWVYFGDIIDTAVSIMESSYGELNEELGLDIWSRVDGGSVQGKFHIVTGNFEFTDSNNKKRSFNLSRFPIPLRTFVDFWTKKVVEKQREVYFLRSFVRDVLVQLVVNPLNKISRSQAPKESFKPHYEILSLPKQNKSKLFTYDPTKNAARNIMNSSYTAFASGQSTEESQEILFLAVQKADQKSLFNNDRKKDIEKGIFYLGLKREGSPVLNISFSRSDQQYLMEARAEKGLLSEVTQLSEVYNCHFTSVGNTKFKPGRFVYITDPHFGDINKFFKRISGNNLDQAKELIYTPEYASMLLGLGGYYLIIKAKHRLKAVNARLVWQTECDCHWNSFGTSIEEATFGTTTGPAVGKAIQNAKQKAASGALKSAAKNANSSNAGQSVGQELADTGIDSTARAGGEAYDSRDPSKADN